MKHLFENSIVGRWCKKIQAIYRQGALHRTGETVKESYASSHARQLVYSFVWRPLFPQGDSALLVRMNRFFQHCLKAFGNVARQSACFRLLSKLGQWLNIHLQGSVLYQTLHRLGIKGLLIIISALYLPIDFVLRNVGALSFVASWWDEGLMLAVFFYLCLQTAFAKQKTPIKATPVDAYLLFFMGVGFLLLCITSPYPAIAVAGLRAVVQYMLWFFLMIRLLQTDADVRLFLTTLLIMATGVALHGIYQYIVAAPIPAGWVSQTEESVRTRVYSITGSPNVMGSFLVLFAPLCMSVVYTSKKTWLRLLALGATGTMCLSCLFTFSKGAWGGLVVAILVFALFLDRRLIAGMLAIGGIALMAIPSIANRITYLFTADYAEASARAGRTVRWATGLELLQDSNIWTGFGLGRFGGAVAMQNKIMEETDTFSYFYMDNYYLKTLVEMGIVGLVAFLILLAGTLLWCLRSIGRLKRTPMYALSVGMFAGMLGVLTHCYFENIFEVPYMTAYFWMLAATILHLGYFRTPAQNKR